MPVDEVLEEVEFPCIACGIVRCSVVEVIESDGDTRLVSELFVGERIDPILAHRDFRKIQSA